MADTAIEWTDKVWNPVTGCTKVSQGCKNCYAERVFPRAYGTERKFIDVKFHPDRLLAPFGWKKPQRIFVNSMSDLFHEDLSMKSIGYVFAAMMLNPRHTFQVLTKRAQRMQEFVSIDRIADRVTLQAHELIETLGVSIPSSLIGTWPLPNVWLGVSVEDQKTANERIPLLLQTPSAVRWISAEPLLGPIDLDSESADGLHALGCGERNCGCGDRGLDWVVCGGESGPGARPMHPAWARSLRDQCQAAKVPFFFKQWGEWEPVQYAQGSMPLLKISVPSAEKAKPSTREIVMHADSSESGVNLVRVGKKAAGRLLYGREWNEYPAQEGTNE